MNVPEIYASRAFIIHASPKSPVSSWAPLANWARCIASWGSLATAPLVALHRFWWQMSREEAPEPRILWRAAQVRTCWSCEDTDCRKLRNNADPPGSGWTPDCYRAAVEDCSLENSLRREHSHCCFDHPGKK